VKKRNIKKSGCFKNCVKKS